MIRAAARAFSLRQHYITVIPGQEMIYLAKEAEAVRYLAEAPETLTEYQMLSAEVGVTAPTAYELAQLWANMSALWRQVAATIEHIRLSAIYAVEAAPDADAITAATSGALDALSQL